MNTTPDWQLIVADLYERARMSQRSIARHLGCSQPYINDIYKSTRPVRLEFGFGTKLLALHETYFPKQQERRT